MLQDIHPVTMSQLLNLYFSSPKTIAPCNS